MQKHRGFLFWWLSRSQRVNDPILRKKKTLLTGIQMKSCLSWTSTGWQSYPTISYISHMKVPPPKKTVYLQPAVVFSKLGNFENRWKQMKTAENSEVCEWWVSLGQILSPLGLVGLVGWIMRKKKTAKSHGWNLLVRCWTVQVARKTLKWSSGMQNCGSME